MLKEFINLETTQIIIFLISCFLCIVRYTVKTPNIPHGCKYYKFTYLWGKNNLSYYKIILAGIWQLIYILKEISSSVEMNTPSACKMKLHSGSTFPGFYLQLTRLKISVSEPPSPLLPTVKLNKGFNATLQSCSLRSTHSNST